MLNFLAKQMLKRQLKGVPDAQVDKLIAAIEADPESFKKLAEKIQAKIASGMSQDEAAMDVMKEGEKDGGLDFLR